MSYVPVRMQRFAVDEMDAARDRRVQDELEGVVRDKGFIVEPVVVSGRVMYQARMLYAPVSGPAAATPEEARSYGRMLVATVAVPKMLNQCDGCRRGLPLDGHLHRDGRLPVMSCTRHLYEDIQ